jgi:hypothetical protein
MGQSFSNRISLAISLTVRANEGEMELESFYYEPLNTGLASLRSVNTYCKK